MCGPKACLKWTKRRIINCWKGCKMPGGECKGFCLCPHGCCYTIMGVMGAFGALWMNMYVIVSCKFQRITELNAVTGEPIESTRRGYGVIGREIDLYAGETEDYKGCVIYPADEHEYLFDFWMTSSRNLAFLGAVLGLICFCLFILAYCIKFNPWTWDRWALWMYIYASLCIAFTMLIYGNHFCKENKCKVAQGTGYAISCFFTYLMMANQVKSMSKPQRTPKTMPRPGGPEDNYWYDGPDDQFPDPSDSEEEDDDDDDEEFDDEYLEGEFQNPPRLALMPGPNDGLQDTTAYDENRPYLADETAYAKPQDPQFTQRDQDIYRQQQQHEPPPMLALPPSQPMTGGPVPPRPQQRPQQQQQQQQPGGGGGGRGGPPGRGGRGPPPPGRGGSMRSVIGPGSMRSVAGPPPGGSTRNVNGRGGTFT